MQDFLASTSLFLAQAAAQAPIEPRGLIATLVIGLVVGAVAKLLTPGRDPGGCIITMLIGIAGSFVAYFIGRALGMYSQGQTPGFIMSVVGAVILLVIYHLARRNKSA